MRSASGTVSIGSASVNTVKSPRALTPLPPSPVGDRRGGTEGRSAAKGLKNLKSLKSSKSMEYQRSRFFGDWPTVGDSCRALASHPAAKRQTAVERLAVNNAPGQLDLMEK